MFRLVWLISCVFAAPVLAADWPQWRGPEGQGHASTAMDLPVQWSVGSVESNNSNSDNICWRKDLPGRAWSSAVIDGETIWLTTAIEDGSAQEGPPPPGGKKPQPRSVAKSVTFRAFALDSRDGQILHDVELFSVDNPQPTHVLNSFKLLLNIFL